MMPSNGARTSVSATSAAASLTLARALSSLACWSNTSWTDTTLSSCSRLVFLNSSSARLASACSASNLALYSVGITLNSTSPRFTACPSFTSTSSRYPPSSARISMFRCDRIWHTYFCVTVTSRTCGVVAASFWWCSSCVPSFSCPPARAGWQAGRASKPRGSSPSRAVNRRYRFSTGFSHGWVDRTLVIAGGVPPPGLVPPSRTATVRRPHSGAGAAVPPASEWCAAPARPPGSPPTSAASAARSPLTWGEIQPPGPTGPAAKLLADPRDGLEFETFSPATSTPIHERGGGP